MEQLVSALTYVLSPVPLGLILAGTFLGITVGAIPGLTGSMLIALSLPLTFSMDSAAALVLLVSMYVGSVSGGLIAATLLRIPGTPAAIMTTFDGYPMARSGRAGRALGLGIGASFVGGLISWCFLVALASPVAILATRLGFFEYFSLMVLALMLIAAVSGESLTKGVLAGLLGALASMPGVSPSTGALRLTFGVSQLNGGLALLPVLIGLFALSQIVRDILALGDAVEPVNMSRSGMILRFREWRSQLGNLTRSSLIGTVIGVLPGVGANIGSVAAYSVARYFSRHPERFGKGSDDGIVASEAANNATVGGALIPLISMGIPGSVVDAILLGAFVIHGLQPGPRLFAENPEIVYTIFGAVLLATIAMLVMMLAMVGWLARAMALPKVYLIPTILVFCVVGSYALNNRMFDVWTMLAFGLLGYALERFGVPLAPFVIGFVLAPLAEENLAAALTSSGGSYWPFVTRSGSLVLLVLAGALLVWSTLKRPSGRLTPGGNEGGK